VTHHACSRLVSLVIASASLFACSTAGDGPARLNGRAVCPYLELDEIPADLEPGLLNVLPRPDPELPWVLQTFVNADLTREIALSSGLNPDEGEIADGPVVGEVQVGQVTADLRQPDGGWQLDWTTSDGPFGCEHFRVTSLGMSREEFLSTVVGISVHRGS